MQCRGTHFLIMTFYDLRERENNNSHNFSVDFSKRERKIWNFFPLSLSLSTYFFSDTSDDGGSSDRGENKRRAMEGISFQFSMLFAPSFNSMIINFRIHAISLLFSNSTTMNFAAFI